MNAKAQWCTVIFFGVTVLPHSLWAAPEVARARGVFDGLVVKMQADPVSKGEILASSQIAVLIDEVQQEVEKMHQTTPETQNHSEDVLNQLKRVKADPYEVEPLIRVVLIVGKLEIALAAKRDFDAVGRMNKIASALEHHLLNIAQIKDAFVDKANIVRNAQESR